MCEDGVGGWVCEGGCVRVGCVKVSVRVCEDV